MQFDLLDFLVRNRQIRDARNHTIRPLHGGYWNQVIRLQGDGVDWIVKIYSDARPHSLFPIFPELEAATLQALQGFSIAPDFVAYYPTNPGLNPAVLIYEFVQGETWQNEVRPVATLFHKVHRLPLKQFKNLRQLPVTPADLLSAGDSFLDKSRGKSSARSLLGKRPGLRTVPSLPELSLVHVDSGAGNIVVSSSGPRLIDWQCPGAGDPVEDINCFLSPAFLSLYGHTPLTNQEIGDFLAAYDDDEAIERYWALLPYLTYRMAAHCCLQQEQRRQTDPEASAAYGLAFDISMALL